jgi:hypothetical protein
MYRLLFLQLLDAEERLREVEKQAVEREAVMKLEAENQARKLKVRMQLYVYVRLRAAVCARESLCLHFNVCMCVCVFRRPKHALKSWKMLPPRRSRIPCPCMTPHKHTCGCLPPTRRPQSHRASSLKSDKLKKRARKKEKRYLVTRVVCCVMC